MIPEKLRVSMGTAAVLGLASLRLDAEPTTAYLMTYAEGGCTANCAFCPQARGSPRGSPLLSRVAWPDYPTERVMEALGRPARDILGRVCIQAVSYPSLLTDLLALMRAIRDHTSLPASLDAPPLGVEALEALRSAGLDRVSIPLDAATPELFDEVKGRRAGGPYSWEGHMGALKAAVAVFGPGRVMSNLILGLGETEAEAVGLTQRLMDMGIEAVLYAFTPVRGTRLEGRPAPPLGTYRRVQLARYLITAGRGRFEEMAFDGSGRLRGFGADAAVVRRALEEGEAFRTSGCPGCNRPFYNERPSGPLYNYPRRLTGEEAGREAAMLEVELG